MTNKQKDDRDIFEKALDNAPEIVGAAGGAYIGTKLGRGQADRLGDKFSNTARKKLSDLYTPEYRAHLNRTPPVISDDTYRYDFSPSERRAYDKAWDDWEKKRLEIGGDKVDAAVRRVMRADALGRRVSIVGGVVGGSTVGAYGGNQSRKYEITRKK